LLQAVPNELGVAEVDQVRSVHLDSSRGWPVDSAEQVQEGRLSAAGRAAHRDELAVGDRHVEPPKGDDLGLSRAIHLDDILRCHVRHPQPPRSFSTWATFIRAVRRDTSTAERSIEAGPSRTRRSASSGKTKK